MSQAVFIDRDGTLSHEVGYVNHLSRFRLFSFAVEAVRLVNKSGLLAVVVTNQAGIARGYFPPRLLDEVHDALRAAMEEGGARLDRNRRPGHHDRKPHFRTLSRDRNPVFPRRPRRGPDLRPRPG